LKGLLALLLEIWIEIDVGQFGRRLKIGSETVELSAGKADDFG